MDSTRVKRRAAVTLLRGLKSRSALGRAKPALLALAGSDDGYAPNQLAAAIEDVLTQLSSEPNGRRRFDVLRRCDVEREPHDAIAGDVGVSRSQFYRDLRDARERFAEAIAERLSGGAAPAIDPRFLAIEALRDGGQYARAASMADVLARAGDREDATRALCLRAELEIENGEFLAARQTAGQAKRLIDGADNIAREAVEAECELADYEAAYCLGVPESPELRRGAIGRLRRRVERGNASLAPVLVKALIQETSLQFGQGDVAAARSAAEEAGTLAAKFPLIDRRLAVDVRIRASGLKALDADRVGSAARRRACATPGTTSDLVASVDARKRERGQTPSLGSLGTHRFIRERTRPAGRAVELGAYRRASSRWVRRVGMDRVGRPFEL